MKRLTTVLFAGLATLFFVACGSSSSSDNGDTVAKTMVPITEENADTVISASVQSISGIMDMDNVVLTGDSSDIAKSTSVLSKLGTIASTNLKPVTLAESVTESCAGGGSVTYDGDELTGGTVTFNECVEYDTTLNGTIVISINGAETSTIFTNFSMTTTGTEVFYSNATVNLNIDTYAMSVTATGYAIDDGSRYDFENYTMTSTGNPLTASASYTFNGFIKTDCLIGWIEIKTNQPLIIGSSCPTAGEIVTIGDNSELKMIFNADESVDVSLNGEAYDTYPSCEDLPEGVCQ